MELQQTWLEAATQLFFPQRHCLLCHELTGKPGLCEVCRAQQAALDCCDICAAFCERPQVCPDCSHNPPALVRVRAALPYEGQLREHLLAFKYHEQTWLSRPLTTLLLELYASEYGKLGLDAVVPVPLSAARYRERGYNQSALVARPLARQAKLAYRPDALQRVRETPPLNQYDGPTRRKILRGAFQAQNVATLTILLVDDIYTSGATMDACARALLAAGARAVYGLTLAAVRLG